MTLLKIARMGHPVLRQMAKPVDSLDDPTLVRLVEDMAATMVDAEGVGLAAPQVHVPRRVIVFRVPSGAEGAEAEREEAEHSGIRAVVNPVIEPLDDDGQELGLEGCLSIPGLRGLVPRWRKIRYRGVTPSGAPVDAVASGFHARVVQHEVDHLDGILYLDRMTDLRSLSFEDELRHLLRDETPERQDELQDEPQP